MQGASILNVSVVIPVYNEESTLEAILNRVKTEVPNLFEIILVDDCSSDNTSQVIQRLCTSEPLIRTVRHSRNQGKTAALKTAFAMVKGDVVIIQDADLEYDPAEIKHVIQPILDGQADVVYGSRFLVRRAARVVYFYHYLANKFLTFLSNALTNLNMTDVETCYKAFRAPIICNMLIESSGFGFEVEVTAKIAKLKCRVYEVPISYYGRTYNEGKKIGTMDGIAAIAYILYYNLFISLNGSFSPVPEEFQN
jgi:glycosyltransferase involved in cell wall biosynthesis